MNKLQNGNQYGSLKLLSAMNESFKNQFGSNLNSILCQINCQKIKIKKLKNDGQEGG